MSDSNTETPSRIGWQWEHTYASLPPAFFSSVDPEAVLSPSLVALNDELAGALGLSPDVLTATNGVAALSGSTVPDGAKPIAQAYAGHQFGNFTMLGDGRAILLGEHVTPDGRRVDIQLKGSGRTPYSRGGDGKAALGPMLREYIIAEAMHGLGIPTTRSLAVVATGQPVYRETELPGAVLTRIASSHLRVGTFEFASRFAGPDAVRALADYAIARHFPEVRAAEHPYRALWQAVAERQAGLVAQWMGVGFVHGVMNTDNVSIAGETIDYGPCAFIEAYEPATVFSSIDQFGRYAYGQQPAIARWNLARFAETLISLFDEIPDRALAWAQEAVDGLEATMQSAWLAVMGRKLGLERAETSDETLVNDWLAWMRRHHLDFTNTFRAFGESPQRFMDGLAGEPAAEFREWHERWSKRISDPSAARKIMQEANPVYIPRNHRVEAALIAAAEHGDLSPFHRLTAVLRRPFDKQPEHADCRDPAPLSDPPYRTFCGT
ncbi:MAG: YdiU family protein [Planctomycetota bacterium]